MRITLFAMLLFAPVAAQPSKAEPKAEKITYRITGLFAPDRERD